MGVVTDQEGITLPGVTIALKGAAARAVTDANGKYAIAVPGPDATLVFSFIGMQIRELPAGTPN